jgi:hypothetical protein
VLDGNSMMPSRETQELARRLLDCEAVDGNTSETTEAAAVRVCEKLRQPLCALTGVAGYQSLLSRALALAKEEAPFLSAMQVTPEGYLEGLGDLQLLHGDEHRAVEGGTILIAQLLDLFLTFLGTALTLRLLLDASYPLVAPTASGVPFAQILHEVDQLNGVSKHLQWLADQHPSVENALLSVSGNISTAATALEIFVYIRDKSRERHNDELKLPATRYLM